MTTATHQSRIQRLVLVLVLVLGVITASCFLLRADAFVRPLAPLRALRTSRYADSSSSSSTALFGFRSGIRRRLTSNRLVNRFFPKKSPPAANDDLETEILAIEDPSIHLYYPNTLPVGQHPVPSIVPISKEQQSQVMMSTTTTITSTTLELVQSSATADADGFRKHLDVMPFSNSATLTRAKTAASTSHVSLYSLPKKPNHRNLTKLENEFRDMLEYFANYSEADLLSIADPRKRALFEGIAASSHSQPVYRAFEVLFEDLLPLRLAGRLVFSRLKEFMATSVALRKEEIQLVVDRTGLSEDIRQLEEIRLMFVSTASQLNGDSYLTLSQLAETGIITATATEVLGFESSEQLLQELDWANTGRLTFIDLMSGLWECANELCGLDNCNPHAVLHNLLVELNEHPPPPADLNARLDANRRKFSARYDEMVSSFVRWQHLLPPPPPDGTTENRRMEVVRGCFVGAEIPKVVDALRIVYVDYAGLRVAGDIIFKLVSTLQNRR